MRFATFLFVALATVSQLSAQDTPPKSKPATTQPTQVGKSDSLEDINSKPATAISTVSGLDLNDILGGWTGWNDKEVDSAKPAKTIVKFGPKLCPAQQSVCMLQRDLYVIHILKSQRAVTTGTETQVKVTVSSWYLYKPAIGRKSLKLVQAVDGKFAAIVGAKSGAIISISILQTPTCKRLAEAQFDCEEAPSIAYDVTTTQKTAANVTALISLLNAVLGIAKPVAPGPPGAFMHTYDAPQFVAKAKIFELDPRPIHAPFDWGLTANVTGTDTGATGDCTKLTTSAKCSYTRTVSVEAPQYWNVGIDITPHGPRENKYALSTSNIVTQSHTIHSPLYASLDFSPWSQIGYRPYFQAGVPLSGAAFHLPFVAIAEPLPFTKRWLQISVYGALYSCSKHSQRLSWSGRRAIQQHSILIW